MAILKNGFTGALMVVAEDRVQEYLDRGHKRYAKAAEPAASAPAKPARKKSARPSARKKAGE